jgi:hypothetical protein
MRFPATTILLTVFSVVTAYFVGLLFTAHPIRASLVRVIEVSPEVLSRSPYNLEEFMRFEDPKLLTRFTSALPQDLYHVGGESPDQVMRWLSESYQQGAVSKKTWLPESPERMFETLASEGIRGSCYNESIMLGTFVQSAGGKARYVSFNSSDGLGGSGHTVTEIWNPDFKKWILFDQQQVARFYDRSTKVPFSAMEIRERVLTMSKDDFLRAVEIKQGSGFIVSKENIWDLYQSSNEIIILGSADYSSRNQKYVMNKMADWIESSLAPFGRVMLVGRFFRAIFGEQPRLRIVDEFTPDLSYTGWYYGFRVAFVAWFMLGFSLVYVFVLAIKQRKHVVSIETIKNSML